MVVVRLGGFHTFVDTAVPMAVLKNRRLFRRWFKAFTRKDGLQDLRPVVTQVARDWGANWHLCQLVFK